MEGPGGPELSAPHAHHPLSAGLYLLRHHGALARDPRVPGVSLRTPQSEPVQKGRTQDRHAEHGGREKPDGLRGDAEAEQGRDEAHDGAEREEKQKERDGKKLADEGKSRQNSPEDDFPIQCLVPPAMSLHHRRQAEPGRVHTTVLQYEDADTDIARASGATMTLELDRDLTPLGR